MTKTWPAIMMFGSICLSGCVSAGLFSQGENASYAFWNNSGEDVQRVEIVGIYQQDRKGLNGTAISEPVRRYVPIGHPIHGFVGGAQYMSDTGHKVPEEVEVSWRKLPSAGGKPYTGELAGPYRVAVRSRFPQEALQLARRDTYSLGIKFSVGKEPILVCWGVVATDKSDHRGRSVIMAGGQCSPEDVAWRSDIDWHRPGIWFPEN